MRRIAECLNSPTMLNISAVEIHEKMNKHQYDFLVIGSGLAGLSFALKASQLGRVAIFSKTRLETGNTEMAQGGIAAVVSKEDSLDNHVQDTLVAGAGLCRRDVVEFVVEQGAERIKDLIEWGVHFDLKDGQNFSLTKEGGHSQRRILHVEDHTGLDIQRQLLAKVRENPDIDLYEDCLALELITNWTIDPIVSGSRKVVGAYFLNKNTQDIFPVLSDRTVLATGGAGKAYLYTSNWSGATADGIAMAYMAGARVANLEFMQFHPTCLFHPEARNFLISEALRGEGGRLINSAGKEFMSDIHPMAALAPRDIVARSIDAEMKKSGADHVFLDMTHLNSDFLKTRFPKIFDNCLKLGIDMSKSPLPVVPAAHYLCGGVLTNMNAQTDVENLFVVGESACTGLHGANRLASNSLLECLAFSESAFQWMKKNPIKEKSQWDPKPWPKKSGQNDDELILVSHMWDEIRRLMWAYVGIVRTNRRLKRAQNRMTNILSEFREFYSEFGTQSDIVELRNIALFADLTVRCALQRQESRGIHYNLDFPPVKEMKPGLDTVLSPNRIDL